MAADKINVNVSYMDPNGKSASKTLTNINPFADDGTTKNFCTALYALSNNTVDSIEKIERTDITNPKLKQACWLSISPATAAKASFAVIDTDTRKLEIEIGYPDVNGDWNAPVVTGTKQTDSTITVEPHKITVTIPANARAGQGAVEMNVFINSKLLPDAYQLKGTIRIYGFNAEDIVNIE